MLILIKALIEALCAEDGGLAGFEGSSKHGGEDPASIARPSSASWRLRVLGLPTHWMGVFSAQSGYGAIYETARILSDFREQVIELSLTFNPGLMFGGTNIAYADNTAMTSAFGKSNVIALGDLRYLSPEQGERAYQKMQAIVAAGNLPGTYATIRFSESYPPMPGSIDILDATLRGAGDVQFVSPLPWASMGSGRRDGGRTQMMRI